MVICGRVGLDLLKDAWTPIWTIESTCRAVQALMGGGDATSPLNCDCGNLIRGGDWRGYWSIARMWTLEYAQRVEEDTEEEKRGEGWMKLKKEEEERKR